MNKQVIVTRRDLKLSKGKLAAQVAHASLEAYKKAGKDAIEEWESSGSKKVVLRVEDEREMMDVMARAKAEKLPVALIRDAGHTEIPAGTVTALGIGPGGEAKIDKVTGKLKML